MDSANLTMLASHDMEQLAKHKARDRVTRERWNRDVTVFTFSILIIVLILLYNDVSMAIVAIVAILGFLSLEFSSLREPEALILMTWVLVLFFSYTGFFTLNLETIPTAWLRQYMIFVLVTLGGGSYIIRRHT